MAARVTVAAAMASATFDDALAASAAARADASAALAAAAKAAAMAPAKEGVVGFLLSPDGAPRRGGRAEGGGGGGGGGAGAGAAAEASRRAWLRCRHCSHTRLNRSWHRSWRLEGCRAASAEAMEASAAAAVKAVAAGGGAGAMRV